MRAPDFLMDVWDCLGVPWLLRCLVATIIGLGRGVVGAAIGICRIVFDRPGSFGRIGIAG